MVPRIRVAVCVSWRFGDVKAVDQCCKCREVLFSFCAVHLVESQFPNQELNLGRGSECLES